MNDDEFQTVTSSNSNELLHNWRDSFAVDHCVDDPNFATPLQDNISNKDASIKVKMSEKPT